MEQLGWIGVDFDATLSHYEGWKGHEFESMGPPIEPMMARVKAWISEGREVKIFTARASIPEQIPAVRQWLEAHEIGHLEITHIKDRFMYQLWDDRAIQVEPNTGKDLETQLAESRNALAASLERERVMRDALSRLVNASQKMWEWYYDHNGGDGLAQANNVHMALSDAELLVEPVSPPLAGSDGREGE